MHRTILPLALLLSPASLLAAPTQDDRASNIESWETMFSHYPAESVAARESGPVGFEVRLDREGQASECKVIQSSGFDRLDRETCRMIMDRGAFKGLTDGAVRRTSMTTRGVVNWVLPDLPAGADIRVVEAGSQLKVRMVADPTPSRDRQVCKRHRVTGTLAGYERVCMSAADWERQRAAIQREIGDLQGSKGSTSGG